jgi:acyl carrier protein
MEVRMTPWPSHFEDLLRTNCPSLGDGMSIEPDTHLIRTGVDSLEIVALVAALEQEFAVDIPPRRLTPAELATPASIWAMLCDLKPALAGAGPAA